MDIIFNFPLLAGFTSIILAQMIKIPITFMLSKEFKPSAAFSTGGMPSSHSAAVASLTTAIGIIEGVNSSLFAIACLFSVITMYDASGVRRHAGEQAILLNQLIKDFQHLVGSAKDWNNRKELKELLGHQPIEVFFGGVFGIIIAFTLYAILF